MHVSPIMYFIVLPLIFLASLIDSIAGGGGVISLPAYLATGLNPATASGSNKFSATFGTLLATLRYIKDGKVALWPAVFSCAAAFPGSSLGAWVQMQLPEHTVRLIMLIAIPLAAATMLIKHKTSVKPLPPMEKLAPMCICIGLICGFYDGFFGPGTGTFLIMLFTWLLGMDMVMASGTAKAVNLASNLAALITFVISGRVLYALAIPATLCSLAGGYLGASLALKGGAKLIRHIMLVVLILLMVTLVVQIFFPDLPQIVLKAIGF